MKRDLQLTPQIIQKVIQRDHRVDQQIDLDGDGVAILYTAEGYTWNSLDDNRSVEGFNVAGNRWEEPDTVGYLLQRLSSIEEVRD